MKNGDPATCHLKYSDSLREMDSFYFFDYEGLRFIDIQRKRGNAIDYIQEAVYPEDFCRLDEDRWQIVLKRPGEMHETFILTGWSGP